MIAPQNENGDEPDSSGGAGELCEGELLTRSQLTRLDRRAMREHWPIPKMAMKKEMVERQVEIAIHSKDNRESTAAYKAVLATAVFNAQAEEYSDPADETNEIEDADDRVSDVLSGIMLAAPALVAGDGGNGKQVDTPRANGKTNGVPKPGV